ncbi:MAG TPA: hypothetical protein VEU94_02370 [Terriglobales bacterium]|nr:hypothetical protein [Terriglobales bacterium]
MRLKVDVVAMLTFLAAADTGRAQDDHDVEEGCAFMSGLSPGSRLFGSTDMEELPSAVVGACTPEESPLSVASEIVLLRRGGSATTMREETGKWDQSVERQLP